MTQRESFKEEEVDMNSSVKIVIGGACTSERLRKELGADAYAEDAVHGVQVFNRLLSPSLSIP